jgi:hypothetical protein
MSDEKRSLEVRWKYARRLFLCVAIRIIVFFLQSYGVFLHISGLPIG